MYKQILYQDLLFYNLFQIDIGFLKLLRKSPQLASYVYIQKMFVLLSFILFVLEYRLIKRALLIFDLS